MQHSEFRQLAGAHPQHLGPAAQAHAGQCAECAEYLAQMRQLDSLMKRAMEVPAPVSGNVTPMRTVVLKNRTPARVFALAASMLLAVMVGAGIWIASSRDTLAADVIVHVREEPDAMVATDKRVTQAELDDVLRRAGVRLKSGTQTVSVARTCPFRGKTIPHLVVQTRAGPITVLVLGDEHLTSARAFDEQGYAGILRPSGRGAVAIIANSPAALDEAAAQVEAAVEWID